jgi:hypothetical protein
MGRQASSCGIASKAASISVPVIYMTGKDNPAVSRGGASIWLPRLSHKAVLGEVAHRATRESIGGIRINRSRRHGEAIGTVYSRTMSNCEYPQPIASFDPGLRCSPLCLGKEIMSYGASIYRSTAFRKIKSFFGRLVMWVAASFSVSSFRPFANAIGSSKRAPQDTNDSPSPRPDSRAS